ncbi:MAG TPA: right-handed parallel beta-helix repeat-containing protein, partial [bacterium]|nr:right-handed parallel beta-helix repeat-containing protein [bacterium]
MVLRNLHRWLPAVVVAAALCGQTLHAADFAVTKAEDSKDGTCDADCSLREAIDAANAAVGSDTISLPAGIYQLKLPNPPGSVPPYSAANDDDTENANVDGDLDVTDELIINGEGAETTIIDGNGLVLANRVFHVDPTAVGASLTLNGVAVQGGLTANNGGGIEVIEFGTLNLVDSIVAGNEATGSSGGGVAIDTDSGSVTIQNSRIEDNKAAFGGGMYSEAVGTLLKNSVIGGNRSSDLGGGLYLDGSAAEILDTQITDNISDDDGGGLVTTQVALFMEGPAGDCLVQGNKAGGNGGGIFTEGDGGTISMDRCRVTGNEALNDQKGGGIYSESLLTLNEASIDGNRAEGDGGGVYCTGQLKISNS